MLWIRRAVNWPPVAKYAVMITADVVVYIISGLLAFSTLRPTVWPGDTIARNWEIVSVGLLVTLAVLWGFGLYKQMIRYAGTEILFEAAKAVTFAIVLGNLAGFYLFHKAFPLPMAVTQWICLLLGVAGTRMLAKSLIYSDPITGRFSRERTAIYGAGRAGSQLLESLQGVANTRIVAFLDDDARNIGRRIRGHRIYASGDIAGLVTRKRIQSIILAMPSIPAERRRDILASLEGIEVKVKTLPGVEYLSEEAILADQVRDINVSDLLWRQGHEPNKALLADSSHGKTVMVTGGGGSIGSELCRQSIRHGASHIVVVDHSELALYSVRQDLEGLISRLGADTRLTCKLADCKAQEVMKTLMKEYGVDTVYHAAAYKHVPIVEENVAFGLNNNVFGTLACAEAAMGAGVKRFVLISSDKAVRPTNVMGASKRLAEIVVRSLQDSLASAGAPDPAASIDNVKFSIVRFGNVLDSTGSVVPLFRQQISNGGPITLTDPDVERYFMTISEASQLVLQASAMSDGGEVFLLDMGEPVKIYDLARRMINLSGLTVADGNNTQGDIKIEITGMRPGEKLHEEMFVGENVFETPHPAIMREDENNQPWSQLKAYLEAMRIAIAANDRAALIGMIGELVEGFPASDLPFSERRTTSRTVDTISTKQ